MRSLDTSKAVPNLAMPYIKIDPIEIYYEIYGQGEPVLLIHGLGASTQDWEYQIQTLATRYQIIVFDIRGHGRTSKPPGPYSITLFADETAKFIQRLYPQGVNVIGHSLGGMIAFQLVIDHPELVKTLTIINSAPQVSWSDLKLQFAFYLRALSIKFFGMKMLSENLAKSLLPLPEHAELRENFKQRWLENDPDAYLSSLRAFNGWNLMKKISTIYCPTLIITADHDYTSVLYKKYYANLMQQAEVAVVTNSYHLSPIDQPQQVNHFILDFLERRIA